MTEELHDEVPAPSGLSRRRLLGLLGAGVAVGAGATAGAEAAFAGTSSAKPAATPERVVAFRGENQAGIITPAQDRLHFAAFDVGADITVAELVTMLKAWTNAAEAMCAGGQVGPGGAASGPAQSPPTDTGEALGLSAANLTLTIGFGPSLFGTTGKSDRFGLAAKRPAQLADLPAFAGDALDPAATGGDLCIQACADDPVVAFHAIRNLARIGRGTVVMRWSQLGFGRTATTSRSQDTPRNLMGLRDGTANIRAEDTEAMARFVWVGDEGPAWMRGGSYLVTRRIRMLLEVWDRSSLEDQEQTIGRHKYSGAPLGGAEEFDPLELEAEKNGQPVIPVDAHVRLASAQVNGERILRRGYSFTDGVDERLGELEAGLFFIAFQRDPEKQFVAIQRRLGSSDALNEYIKHVGSAVFAVPPGARNGGYVGESLLG
jgi:deferrochelatase/peroxidase EfeB